MTSKTEQRDLAWPEVANTLWGLERMAIRHFMKTEWKKDQKTVEKIPIERWDARQSEQEAAQEEATEILKWWRMKCTLKVRPETNSLEFVNWVLQRYHQMCEEREKVDYFERKVPGPRGCGGW